MITVDGNKFSQVFASIPKWLGEKPAMCYLIFDGATLRIRAMTGLCLAEYVFKDLKIEPQAERFVAPVAFDSVAGAFKGQKSVTWSVSNRNLNFKAGRYKGNLVLSEARDIIWPNKPQSEPQTWISELIAGSDQILLKKKISSVNPLTVFFRQQGTKATLCTADGIHFIVSERQAVTAQSINIAIPYTSFALLMAAFKKPENPLRTFVTASHLIIEDGALTLSVPLLDKDDNTMSLELVEKLIADTKERHTAHVVIDSDLDLLSSFIERGKSLQDTDRPPGILLKIQEGSLFVQFDTTRGGMEDTIGATIVRGTPGNGIKVDAVALMDILTTMAAGKVSFVIVEDTRLALIARGNTQQTGMVVGLGD